MDNYTYDAIHNLECFMAVYVDLSKAFDTFNHNILLRKVNHVEVRERVFNLFRPYLTDCKQYTAVEGMYSTSKVIESGIPHRLNLRSLLILIY